MDIAFSSQVTQMPHSDTVDMFTECCSRKSFGEQVSWIIAWPYILNVHFFIFLEFSYVREKSWRDMLCSVAFDLTFFELSDTSQIVFKYYRRLFLVNYFAWFLYVVTHWPKPHTFSTCFVKRNNLCLIRRCRNQSLFMGPPRDHGSTNCKNIAGLWSSLMRIW